MISGASAIGSDWFLDGLSNLNRQLLTTQQQLSSGYRINDASDAPAQTPELIALGSNLASLQSYQTSLGRVQAEANTGDSALGTGISLLDQARTLALNGANTATTASERLNLAQQVQNLQQQLVSVANTTVEGRYIFGGGADTTPPYQYDAASPTGVDALTAPGGGRVIVDPAGQTIFQPGTASNIFDPRDALGAPTASNTFATLQSLATALLNNDQAGVANTLTGLQSSSDWVNQQQATYGVAETRISSEQNDTATQITAVQTQISGIRDTDVAAAASDLARETTAQSAAFAAQAEVPRKSLFDYLG